MISATVKTLLEFVCYFPTNSLHEIIIIILEENNTFEKKIFSEWSQFNSMFLRSFFHRCVYNIVRMFKKIGRLKKLH